MARGRPQRRTGPGFQTLGDLEEAARHAVSERVWGYIQGGAGAEHTLRANEAAFDRWALVPAVLTGIRSVDLTTSVLGRKVSAPFFVAPTAYHRQVHAGGEVATATAASGLGLLGVYSTLSSDPLEAIAAASGPAPFWFQLYLQPRLDASLELVQRAERAGFSAIVVTVDTPLLGSRDRQGRSGFALGPPLPIGNGPAIRTPPRGPSWEGKPYALEDAGEVSWEALDAIRRSTRLPLVVKGILRPDDARRAVELGAKGIVVSNHGGRQLDRSPAALDVLPSIVEAVGSQIEVYLDGGVRRGSDVLIALSLGARAVGLGRSVLWALAAGGRPGVDHFLRLLGTEVANALLLLGRSSVGEVDRSSVAPAGPTVWSGAGVLTSRNPGPDPTASAGAKSSTGRRA